MMRDNELTGLAHTLGRDHRMTITLGGETSYCTPDGNHINIARMPATPLGRLLMTGLIFHEVAHKHHTRGMRPAGLLGELTNVIEDIRVEALLINERPGTAYDLEAVTCYYVGKGALIPTDLPQALLGLVMAYGRAEILGQQTIGSLQAPCREKLAAAFGKPWVQDIEQILEQGFPQLAATNDACRLAEVLSAKFRQAPQRDLPSSPQERQQKQAAEQEDGGGSATGNAPEKDGQDDQDSAARTGPETCPGDPTLRQEQSVSGSENKRPASKGDTAAHQRPEDAPSLKNAEEKSPQPNPPSQQQIEQMLLNGSGGFGDLSAMLTRDLTDLAARTPRILHNETPLLPKVGRRQPAADKLDETQALCACARMRARLLTLLQAQTLKPKHYSSSGRRLVTKRLVRMAYGDARIFTRRIETGSLSTAVVILLDTSGSMMDGSPGGLKRCEVANSAAFALHATLKGLAGVVVASAEFSLRSEAHPSVNLLVDFSDVPKSQAFNIRPGGGTPTPDALWYARAALLQRPESRKIILLLTDGYPVDGAQTKAATWRCETDGIEVAALGIETPAVRRYWSNAQVITDVRELPEAMFQTMENLLVANTR